MSVAIENGAGTPALLPPKPPKLAPRASPYHKWLPVLRCRPAAISGDQLLSTDGGGAVPSRVWPYHSLFIACACSGVTQLGEVPVAPVAVPVHITLRSSVGS